MKKLYYFLIFLIVISCNGESSVISKFDKIDYYYLGISEVEEVEIIIKKSKSFQEEQFSNIIDGSISVKSDAQLFVNELKSSKYFKEKSIPPSLNSDISDLFIPYNSSASLISSSITCEHFYRDILVFKKDNKIVGVTLICFSCGSVIYKTANHSEYISANFEELEKILKPLAR